MQIITTNLRVDPYLMHNDTRVTIPPRVQLGCTNPNPLFFLVCVYQLRSDPPTYCWITLTHECIRSVKQVYFWSAKHPPSHNLDELTLNVFPLFLFQAAYKIESQSKVEYIYAYVLINQTRLDATENGSLVLRQRKGYEVAKFLHCKTVLTIKDLLGCSF